MKNGHKRTRQEIVIEALLVMVRTGEAVCKHVELPLQTGGISKKTIYNIITK